MRAGSTPTWTPIRYVNESYSRARWPRSSALAASAAWTPLRDGMNLVAKEYVAAQNPDDPGVLGVVELRRRCARARTPRGR